MRAQQQPDPPSSPPAASADRDGRSALAANGAASGEALAAVVLNGLGDLILALDHDWRVTDANDAAVARFGQPRQELLGQNLFTLWPALRDAEAERALQRVRHGGRGTEEFAVFQPAAENVGDGGGRWDCVKAHWLNPGGNHGGGLLLVSWEITARKRAEEDLRLSEARYRSLAHTTAGTVWVATPEGGLQGSFPQWEEFTGQTPERSRGWGWLEAVHPEDRPGVETAWHRALAAREPLEIEFRALPRDRVGGEVRHLLARGAPVFEDEASGTVREWVGTCRDVSRERRAEAGRREEERHARLLAEAGTLLAGALDYAAMLRNVADLAVRGLADFCFFDVLDPGGELRRVAWAHADPARREHFSDAVRFVPSEESGHPIRRVLRTGRSEFMPRMGVAQREEVTVNASHADYLRRLDPSAAIFVPVPGRGEEILGVLTLSRLNDGEFNVTELRLAEELGRRAGQALDHARLHEAVRDSEARFRSLVAAMPQMIWTSAPDGTIDFVNDRWVEYFGRSAEHSATEAHWREMIHPDDATATLEKWERSLASGHTYECEARLRQAANGAFRWHLARAVPLRDAEGRIVRWFGTATDVHAHRLAEQARRAADRGREEALSLLDSLLTNAPIGFAFFDHRYRFARVNDFLAGIHGVPVEEHLGRPVREVLPANAAAMEEAVDRVFATGRPVQDLEINGETPAAPGQRRTWLTGFFPVLHPEDDRVEWVGVIVLEVTRQKQLESELQARAAALADADRRKDEFLAMLAHELRNPLAAAGNAATLLRPGASPGDRAWAVGVIERQVSHLARLIDDLLDVSRITQDKIRLRKRLLDPAALVQEAVECVRPLLTERRHELTVHLPDPPSLPPLDADPTRVEQILVNLLTNAARYTEPGGRISLRLHAGPDGGHLVFQVRDNGAGIPPDQLESIFELFAQGDRSLARSEGGLGLGLTIVKKLTELHGGTVTAASAGPGQGSEFTVRLPAAPRPAADAVGRLPGAVGEASEAIGGPPEHVGEAPEHVGGAPEAVGKPREGVGDGSEGVGVPSKAVAAAPGAATRPRVLVVDDNADTTGSLARLLRLRGYEAVTAHRGLEALDLALPSRPAVVLLDIGLPDLDGYEVALRLRQQEAEGSRPRAVLIAISGYGQDEDRRRSREAGFDHHLVKPVDFRALMELVGQVVAG